MCNGAGLPDRSRAGFRLTSVKPADADSDPSGMAVWSWIRRLRPRQLVGLVLLGGILVVGAQLRGVDQPNTVGTHEPARPDSEPARKAQNLARDVYKRVNDERTGRGLPPLEWDKELARLAEGWSEHMIESDTYEHSPDSYRTTPTMAGGHAENIAAGPRDSTTLHIGWMRSEGHRRNILHPGLDAIGIGIVCQGDGAMWATQIFGRYEPGPLRASVEGDEEPIIRSDPGLRCPE